jgi:hypothetical protein
MEKGNSFIRAYHCFRDSVDFDKTGILPELDHVIWCMVMGIPRVPADEDPSPESDRVAIDQRVAILKAVFVEVNREQADDFLDQGLLRYDQAGTMAKDLLESASLLPETAEKSEGT